jgi:hypothetical protein
MSDKKFQVWLNSIVKDGLLCDKRKSCIRRFTRALCKFITSRGYTIGISEPYLRNCIATGLFENSRKSHIASEWNYSDVNTEYSEEEFIHYNFIMDSEAWESFWLQEGMWGNVHPEQHHSEDRRLDIQNFIWKQISLSDSSQTEELHEILTGGDDEITSPTWQGDMYLQETVEYNGWGGMRR